MTMNNNNVSYAKPSTLILVPFIFWTCLCFVLLFSLPIHADEAEINEPQSTIQTNNKQNNDRAIAQRIKVIFKEIPSLHNVDVNVQAGVVQLSGTTIDSQAATRAVKLIARVDGVVTIENGIERDVSLAGQLTPVLEESLSIVDEWINILPLLGLAITVFFVVAFLGHFIAGRTRLWQRITPNIFIAELLATTLRVIFIILATVLALNLLGATALLTAVLGSAGVIGLAIGFAIRDTIENYIASIMLSLRQPFRPRDHVVINGQEGLVIRLTSRATILMTFDGNHLRIPNAVVFKSSILNYSSNPERRFEFELGIDADDDPLAAIETGIEALCTIESVLSEPAPNGVIDIVGDSNIVIKYMAWINQQNSDFGKSRSLALAKVKNALETAGFGLPEPIYRLRFDNAQTKLTEHTIEANPVQNPTSSLNRENNKITTSKPVDKVDEMDVSPDYHIDNKLNEERQLASETDLLTTTGPIE